MSRTRRRKWISREAYGYIWQETDGRDRSCPSTCTCKAWKRVERRRVRHNKRAELAKEDA